MHVRTDDDLDPDDDDLELEDDPTIARAPVDPVDDDEFESDEASEIGASHERPKRWTVDPIHSDPDFEAIDKPAGLSTVSERWRPQATTVIDEVWRRWRRVDPDAPRPHVVHRLDRDTTGVLLFARHRDAQVALREQFRLRTVNKTYEALVTGVPSPAAGRIEIEVEVDPRRPGGVRTVRRGKPCRTDYEVLEVFREHAWVRLHPHQGRTHQIRISLQSIGHPCVVDARYGSADPLLLSSFKRHYRAGRGRPEHPLLARLGLHAARLELAHPMSGQVMAIEAPLPKDLSSTLRQLRRWARWR
ncbi:MAG: RluA family pseudouridine synthase [Planctomycetes bacterium]|nr:RluA family pseudouridine synthase [Planctomycetota bacterium]